MNTMEDAAVQAALDAIAPTAVLDVERALRQQLVLQAQRPIPFRQRVAARTEALPRFTWPAVAAAVVIAVVLSFTTAPVRSLAAQFLPLFRVQDVTPITLDNLTQPLPNLSKLGDMSPDRPGASAGLHATRVASVSAASSAVQFPVLTPSHLPGGVASQPVVVTTQGETVSFTFREQKAKAYLASIGRTDFALPAKFDGAMLQLHIEPAAGLAYLPAGTDVGAINRAVADAQQGDNPASSPPPQDKQTQRSDAAALNNLLNGPGLFIVETKSPSLDAQGVTADELRSFLLSVPGLPATTKQQLSAIGDWTHTLPIPQSAGSSLHKVQVNGAPGVAGKDGNAEIVVWVNNGMLYVVTGPKADEKTLLDAAGSMK